MQLRGSKTVRPLGWLSEMSRCHTRSESEESTAQRQQSTQCTQARDPPCFKTLGDGHMCSFC